MTFGRHNMDETDGTFGRTFYCMTNCYVLVNSVTSSDSYILL